MALCSSSSKAMMKELGIQTMTFYDQKDFLKQTNRCDILFDTVGCTRLKSCSHLLKTEGKFVSVAGLSQAIETKAQVECIKTLFEKVQKAIARITVIM
jgi:NADPH:quinone reductase-like Zn-dependent oxidoreductase